MLRCFTRDSDVRPTFAQLNIMLLSLHNKFNPVTIKERLTGIIKPSSKRPRCPPPDSQEFADATGTGNAKSKTLSVNNNNEAPK